MVSKRALPERKNPLIDTDNSPSHEILVERRRLGQTNLAVRPGIVGVASASKAENLGTFDYAHLRVPLPKDLAGSGIFTLKTATSYPESYFLMRRSSDGFISATGMFKAAYPWASMAEEEAERRFQKTFPSAGPDEVAGSVWITPDEALQLAEEYGMRLWVEALLDSTPIEKGSKDRQNTHIQMPPRFELNKSTPAVILPPSSALRPTRARSTRSASPSKIATPSRKMASPRKSRRTPKPEASKAEEISEAQRATSATSALQHVLENGTNVSESVASESVNGEIKVEDSVRIEVQETVEQNGEVETTTTNVKIDVPVDHPELPTPEDPTKLIEEAKRMVEEAKKLDGGPVQAKSSKRKVEDLLEDDDEAEEGSAGRPAKQAKVEMEQKLTKEKVTRRALVGLGVMAAIGSAFQYFS
ncbi:apses transcription factor-like protein [Polyplosphaeria fusca]|uniref:Apses transcription factor-like protein n=1 Tax=Polyplosphaeria fusca TaxID=682080 RepID=A0A9P4V6Z2_9PLEO|nr:apses transcription factor-like protein [Polyplosphaeria fusca]